MGTTKLFVVLLVRLFPNSFFVVLVWVQVLPVAICNIAFPRYCLPSYCSNWPVGLSFAVSSPPVCKTSLPIQSPHSRYLQSVSCQSSVSYFVSLQPVCKTVPLNLVQPPYLFICHLFCVVSVRLEDGISITGYDGMASAIPTCPDVGTSYVRLENATSQPCYSATLNVCAPALTE